ncbi:hypothetical protein FGG08_001641 [Glutinoglossum americanum]|uniref:Sec20 C-terminal domain-containing protein n=1 Tax=Glutinoglossum americanum TaxID=1670608 RepID=A0A9P8ID88_9PEZI|nr:hypothetical protein FGG08_001641 [Glutinoglossum americanum]
MSRSPLPSRLGNLSESHRVTLSLITRLSKLSIQPGSTSLANDGNDSRLELAAEIHQELKEQEDALELLRQEVDDHVSGARGAERERERARLEASVARIEEDLKLARSQFRKAQLQAKRNAEVSQRKERELLFSKSSSNNNNSRERQRGQEKLSQDELLVNASGDVTAALRRTHQVMQSELSRSQFAHDTLQQSTAALATLSENYNSLDSLLSSSRNLLGTLLRSQKSDTWYLETAFYILLSTIVWLFFRRILYGPLWWLVWLPLKGLYWILGTTIALATGSASSGMSVSLQEASVTTTRVVTTQHPVGGDRPTFVMGQAISIPVGGGGRGRPGPYGTPSPAPRDSERSAMEEVERVIDDSQGQQLQGDQEAGGEGSDGEKGEGRPKDDAEGERRKPNPKKRMWEEDKEARKEEERKRDEL